MSIDWQTALANLNTALATIQTGNPFAYAEGQVLESALQSAGAAYEIAEVTAVNIATTRPTTYSTQTPSGATLFAYSEIPNLKQATPASATEIWRSARYLALSTGLSAPGWSTAFPPTWPTPWIVSHGGPSFASANPEVASMQIVTAIGTFDDLSEALSWATLVTQFYAAQSGPIPELASSFYSETFSPMVANAVRWIQLLRSIPIPTWSAGQKPPAPPGGPAEALAPSDPILIALQTAIADAVAYTTFLTT